MRYLVFISVFVLLLLACQVTLPHYTTTYSSIEHVIIPEIESDNGGNISGSGSSRGVTYFNVDAEHVNDVDTSPYYHGTRDESDIQMDETIRHDQDAKRYFQVSGIAIPDDSGYTDRYYHAVIFEVINSDSDNSDYFSIPVDSQNRFNGYIYFKETGKYKVYAFRSNDYLLYPRSSSQGTDYIVKEGYSTLLFYVNNLEAVPSQYAYLIPTRNIDCGTKSVRDFASNITQDCTNDFEKAKAVYEYLVDPTNDFVYTDYNNIYSVLNVTYNDVFIASHFLGRKKGVCNDFAELYAASMRSLGFKVKITWGYKPITHEGHMWNLIDLTGDEVTWLRVDATFGNTDYSNHKTYAEFYPEFSGSSFDASHSNTFSTDQETSY